jgi:glycosyltransferase involved in cell wall biosynthesis
LVEAVASVLGQSHSPYELIVVDDGSSDGTQAWLAARDDLRAIHQAHTGMPGQVRNRGIEEASGELIAFLDSDDLWRPGKLEHQLAAVGAGGPPVQHTRELWLRDGVEVSQSRQRHSRVGDLFAESLRKCVIGPSTVLLPRTVLQATGRFREDLEVAEDYELWLRITARYRVGFLDEPLAIKRAGHGDQLSERHGHIELFRLTALQDLLAGGWQLGPAQRVAAYQELARKCRIYAAGCAKRQRSDEASAYYALADRYTEHPRR